MLRSLNVQSRAYEVAIWSDASGYRLQVNAVGDFAVSLHGKTITCIHIENEAEIEQVIIGPLLSIALALQGVFGLHASAVTVAGQAVAFVGDSGAGKSTLARHLGSGSHPKLQRIADDVLPVAISDGLAQAVPHFPQLRLGPAQQVGADVPQALPIKAIYVLGQEADAMALTPLGQHEAATTLIRHTLASSLFDDALLIAHLDFCARLARDVPVWKLSYPHRLDALREVGELLLDV